MNTHFLSLLIDTLCQIEPATRNTACTSPIASLCVTRVLGCSFFVDLVCCTRNLISLNMFIIHSYNVNSLTRLSTCRLLLLIKTLHRRFCGGVKLLNLIHKCIVSIMIRKPQHVEAHTLPIAVLYFTLVRLLFLCRPGGMDERLLIFV